MDRHTTNIAKAQGGFIDHFIKPAYKLLEYVLPNISLNMKFLESNKEQWAILEESYDLENDPNVNFRGEEDIIAESEFDPSESDESSMDIIQKDLHWRKQSIMIARKRGTIVSKSFLKKSIMSQTDKSIVRAFTGSDVDPSSS
jgi:hypothetical protein